ncbi:Maf family protein [Thiohalophilus thiocyanatoxydans]|uniref:dTTP/UTP pyrophosphatase n=1 Tax=Thiohalophilus thiocyanatoxydans TaxID=381308 RepID=A0A4R8IK05_9GAMM|nr:Maf family protein [Thiohalophilus thiocyanatoxydans]TDY01072.1 septum formation protein [Thiohalophilus thiocyanatoxydans]
MGEFELYLASASPRRRELLAQIGMRYQLLNVSISEIRLDDETAENYVRRVARDKARAGRQLLARDDSRPVLGADTVVMVDDSVLGKPRDRAEALSMLQQLSGREHQVLSSVALIDSEERLALNRTQVSFRKLGRVECERYWDTGECRDKAGAYAIQGYAAAFVRELRGSYSGVMGLPLYETAQLLQQAGIGLFGNRNEWSQDE